MLRKVKLELNPNRPLFTYFLWILNLHLLFPFKKNSEISKSEPNNHFERVSNFSQVIPSYKEFQIIQQDPEFLAAEIRKQSAISDFLAIFCVNNFVLSKSKIKVYQTDPEKRVLSDLQQIQPNGNWFFYLSLRSTKSAF